MMELKTDLSVINSYKNFIIHFGIILTGTVLSLPLFIKSNSLILLTLAFIFHLLAGLINSRFGKNLLVLTAVHSGLILLIPFSFYLANDGISQHLFPLFASMLIGLSASFFVIDISLKSTIRKGLLSLIVFEGILLLFTWTLGPKFALFF